MARSKSASSSSQPLAIELLMSDHRKVEDLFERGSTLVQVSELNDGVWTAVCEKMSG